MRATPYIQVHMHRAHRSVAQRIVRAYRTTWYATATALAGIPPLELQANMHTEIYRRIRELRVANPNAPPRAKRMVRLYARRLMFQQWSRWLAEQTVNLRTQRVVAAIQPRLEDWARRGKGGIPYRTTQIYHIYRTWLLRRLSVLDRSGAHGGMPPLRRTGRHGATHLGGVPDMGGGAPCPDGRSGARSLAPGAGQRHAGEREIVEGGAPLLRGSDLAKRGAQVGPKRRSGPQR